MRNFPCSLVILVLLTQASDSKPLTYVLPEETATLRPGPGVETARDMCMSCHSGDYINTQPPRSGSEFWEAEVKKMIKSYHAPISEADAKTITDYLVKTY
jgi:hypothetical protein